MTVVPGPRGWPLAYDYQAAGRTARIGRDATAGCRCCT
jgi:phage portal protein BeeE